MPASMTPTLGRWFVYNTSECVGVKENGSLYFFSAAILSVDANCLGRRGRQAFAFLRLGRDHPRLDRRVVGDDEAAPLARDEGGADQLGQGAGQRVDADSGVVDALIQGVGCPLGLGQGCLARRLPRATSTSTSAWL